jgi:hypothetical protein
MVVFTTSAANEPFYREKFDAAVKHIIGLHRPPWWAWARNRLVLLPGEWLAPFILVVLVGFVGFSARRRRRPAA